MNHWCLLMFILLCFFLGSSVVNICDPFGHLESNRRRRVFLGDLPRRNGFHWAGEKDPPQVGEAPHSRWCNLDEPQLFFRGQYAKHMQITVMIDDYRLYCDYRYDGWWMVSGNDQANSKIEPSVCATNACKLRYSHFIIGVMSSGATSTAAGVSSYFRRPWCRKWAVGWDGVDVICCAAWCHTLQDSSSSDRWWWMMVHQCMYDMGESVLQVPHKCLMTTSISATLPPSTTDWTDWTFSHIDSADHIIIILHFQYKYVIDIYFPLFSLQHTFENMILRILYSTLCLMLWSYIRYSIL